MPTMSGFEVCRQIRADTELASTRVVMLSSKPYETDREAARETGADGYIIKPLTADKFSRMIADVGNMAVGVWGVRGTMPTPGEGSVRYGGNTSCYSLKFASDRYFIFDAGTGIKRLSNALMGAGTTRITADLFVTHPHWDHIQGFPFFVPLYIPGNEIRVHGAAQPNLNFSEVMTRQMDGTFFPVTRREFGGHVSFTEVREMDTNIDGARIRSIHLKHPGNTLGYRVDYRDRSFCYITDNELYPHDSEFVDHEFEARLIEFCRGANIMIHDITYHDADYAKQLHWGHSSPATVCRLAHAAEVEELWVHHHDPDQDDEGVEAKLESCRAHLAELGSDTVAVAPVEGTSRPV